MKNRVLGSLFELAVRSLRVLLLVSFVPGIADSFAEEANPPVIITLDLNQTAQPIRNIGSSGCWYSENIGRYWPEAKKERVAELLFSRELDETGSPRGIGLSAWRFNIGGGTAEQGDESGIRNVERRVECFLDADGNYDWSKQAGYIWFVQKAQAYGVENLIAFSNTPPVSFTQNGYGYKTAKDHFSNLRPDKVDAFAEFLVTVVKHFADQGLRFDYLSPIHEPQWDWSNTPGQASQEGCPWQNEEIFKVVEALEETLKKSRMDTQILVPEAARLGFLYQQDFPEADVGKSQQIATFWNSDSPLYLGKFEHVCHFMAGHSYFTDDGDEQLISTRRNLARDRTERPKP